MAPTVDNGVVQRLLATLAEHDKNGDGTISRDHLSQVLRALDGSGYWTDERLNLLFDLTKCGPSETGRIDFKAFIMGICTDNGVDYAAVRADLVRIMNSPDWDDGSYAPILIRLAWHSSGTYDKNDGSGGSNGATMRHSLEASDPENAGLANARNYLEAIKAKYPALSYADLWILAAYVSIEHTGGPSIPFTGGRTDAPAEKAVAPGRLPGAERGVDPSYELDEEGRLKGWEKTAQHIRDVFGRMGLNDQETVALICGGHVYGRCHTESSGYAGAWVENPTRFSSEYAADLIGDKWICVTHDTKMPDGGEVPEEVRPAPGKYQYIDLSKYEPEEEDAEAEARQAPDAQGFPPGRYRCVSQWVNCRELPDVESPIIGRFNQEEELNLLAVKIFGTAVRGRAERGGWVSIIASGGKTLFERVSDLQLDALVGQYRAAAVNGVPTFQQPTLAAPVVSPIKNGEEFTVTEVRMDTNGQPNIFGKLQQSGSAETWVHLHTGAPSPVEIYADLIVEGFNEKPRKPIKGQTGHQMMLVTDMVLLWDPEFKQHVEYYCDEDNLKRDFGMAFRKLTELGCPWVEGPKFGGPAKTATGGGCPMGFGTGKCPMAGSGSAVESF
eukprot:gnl/TRDRNA2_/TRDRNA2_162664_c0_seq2.p1 gnl/TRDRNA2_/TRDRNA2_162664_c0~~gnl/TRDRNA2_/TRDRNA2_162664_c0_seq2.p1  ORF type:complete len:612 (+),score=119.09 gnl/TRDRNA2_/TRDRNA2_162664_c0_seq2:64-1899(+)